MFKSKKQLRAYARTIRSEISGSVRTQHSKAICGHITGSRQWQDAKSVAVYSSFRDEVDTRGILEQAVAQGKQLLLPKVIAKAAPLAFFEVRPASGSLWPLVEGTFGVQEPDGSCIEVPLTEIDLLLVPALALDPSGGRLGWGGGFYDRTIVRCLEADVLAIIFDCQVLESVPTGDHDQPVDGWVSELGVRLVGA